MKKTYEDITPKIIEWQLLSDGQEKDDLFSFVYETLKGLMISKVSYYAKKTEQVEDCTQEMAICLVEAMERFDPTRKVKFATFFMFYIRKALLIFWKTRSTVSQSRYNAQKYQGFIEMVNIETMPDAPSLDFNAEIQFVENRIDFEKNVNRLSATELECIILTLNGWSPIEIAKKTKLSKWGVTLCLRNVVKVCNGLKRFKIPKRRMDSGVVVTKISEETKNQIRSKYKKPSSSVSGDGYTMRQLAEDHGYSIPTIRKIINGDRIPEKRKRRIKL